MSNLWNAAWESTTMPAWWLTIIFAVIGMFVVFFDPSWRVARHLVTLAHESGHAVVGVLTGRRLHGIKLHNDTSGVTTTSGVGWGFGGLLTTFAGYPAPAAVGGLILLAAALGRSNLAAGILLLILLALLLFIRNLWGFLITLIVIGILAGGILYFPPLVLQAFILTVGFLLIAGSFRTILEERMSRKRGSKETDIAVLGQKTTIPATVWWVLALAISAGWVIIPVALMIKY